MKTGLGWWRVISAYYETAMCTELAAALALKFAFHLLLRGLGGHRHVLGGRVGRWGGLIYVRLWSEKVREKCAP